MNKNDSINEVIKFLKKLNYKIENCAKVKIFGKCIIEKLVIDDILCCIDSSIPQEYKLFIEKYAGKKTLQSDKDYKLLCNVVKQKLFFNSDFYIIDISQAKNLIISAQKYFPSDISYIFSDESGMI